MKQIKYNDKGAKDFEALQEGDTVCVQPFKLDQKTRDKAVLNKQISERSYETETAKGSFTRNRVHLRKTKKEETENKVQRSVSKELESTKENDGKNNNNHDDRESSESQGANEFAKDTESHDIAKNSPLKPIIESKIDASPFNKREKSSCTFKGLLQ